MKSRVLLTALLAIAALPALARASITTSLVQIPNIAGEPATLKTYDVRITTDQDWTNQKLTLNLTQGTLFQETPFGADSQPNPALFAAFPDVQWDTFFTTPGGYPNVAATGTTPSFATNTQTATSLDVSWFDSVVTGPGTYTVARITMSSNAVGAFSGLGFDAQSGGVGTAFSGAITAVPEPGSLVAMSVGSLLLIARKRRRF
ncbi:MAG TPA: PEP-CTERM sorting domain-containing protein [Phycisphaerae bacterium]|jgi:hypothetical protein|nr:PEP-CTERM sorting domain-containing protein [Phycisphaerae bacterium]